MHIAINAQKLLFEQSYRSAGISRYSQRLLENLAQVARDWSFTAFVPATPPPGAMAITPNLLFRASRLPTSHVPVRVLWEQVIQPVHLARLGVDLLHSLAYASPLVWRGPSVLTVFDLSFMRFPKAFNVGNRIYLAAMARLSARKAHRIVTISEHTRRDVVSMLGIDPTKVRVTYCGVEESFRPIEDSSRLRSFREANGLTGPYILYVGTIEPRKNVDALMEAFARLRRSGLKHRLVIVGAPGWRYARVFAKSRELGIEDVVTFAGYVSFDDLPLWYNAADVFVYPSMYEGFGLPPLEAMACGTPVIASDSSSLPEVVGDAGLLVPPGDVAELAAAIHRVLEDSRLRERMRAAGLQRAGRFSWRTMAEQTRQTYQELLAVRAQ